MQCDVYHPFQILADLMTIIEKVGDPRGKTINVSWAYASSYQKPISVPQSLILQMTRFGMNVRLDATTGVQAHARHHRPGSR